LIDIFKSFFALQPDQLLVPLKFAFDQFHHDLRHRHTRRPIQLSGRLTRIANRILKFVGTQQGRVAIDEVLPFEVKGGKDKG
jgi:hypothetical protein